MRYLQQIIQINVGWLFELLIIVAFGFAKKNQNQRIVGDKCFKNIK